MKKFIILLVVIVGCGLFYSHMRTQQEDKAQADYDKIQQLITATEKVAYSGAAYKLNEHTKYVLEVSSVHTQNEDFFKNLSEELGSDFDGKLSNGDKLYVSIQQGHKNNTIYPIYAVFAGGYEEKNQLYPDWNYEKLQKK